MSVYEVVSTLICFVIGALLGIIGVWYFVQAVRRHSRKEIRKGSAILVISVMFLLAVLYIMSRQPVFLVGIFAIGFVGILQILICGIKAHIFAHGGAHLK